MRYYLGQTDTYKTEVEETKPRPAPRPVIVKPLPVPEPAPVPPPIPYQTQMETPYGIVKAPRGTKVVGTFATGDKTQALELQAIQAKLEESYKPPEFSLPSKLVKPGEKVHEGGVPAITEAYTPATPQAAQAVVHVPTKGGATQADIDRYNIELEIFKATQYAQAEARKQYEYQPAVWWERWLYGGGRGGGSCRPWRGSCTEEADALFSAIEKGGPYQHIGFSKVRRAGHSAVAVYPKGRGMKFDEQMIVFDPYNAPRGEIWHAETARTWQGGLFGMWKYKVDPNKEDRSP